MGKSSQVKPKALEKKATVRIHCLKKKFNIISIYTIRLNYHTHIKCWAHASIYLVSPMNSWKLYKTSQSLPLWHCLKCLAHTPEAAIKVAIKPGVHKRRSEYRR